MRLGAWKVWVATTASSESDIALKSYTRGVPFWPGYERRHRDEASLARGQSRPLPSSCCFVSGAFLKRARIREITSPGPIAITNYAANRFAGFGEVRRIPR